MLAFQQAFDGRLAFNDEDASCLLFALPRFWLVQSAVEGQARVLRIGDFKDIGHRLIPP